MKMWTALGFIIVAIVSGFVIVSLVSGRAFWLFTIMYFIGCYYTLIALKRGLYLTAN